MNAQESPMLFRVRWLVVALGLTFLSGCGGPKLAPVKGRVMWNGKPVAQAHLSFSPVAKDEANREPGKPATGFTDADGNFVLSTYRPLDGAQVGEHRVVISLDDTNPARCKRKTEMVKEVKGEPNDLIIEIKD